jgi:hypothetical protein
MAQRRKTRYFPQAHPQETNLKEDMGVTGQWLFLSLVWIANWLALIFMDYCDKIRWMRTRAHNIFDLDYDDALILAVILGPPFFVLILGLVVSLLLKGFSKTVDGVVERFTAKDHRVADKLF